MGKAGRKHFYAINQPEEYRGVYHDCWELDVSATAGSSGAWYKRFEDRQSAQYFAAHGHEKGQDHKKGGACWVCDDKGKSEKEIIEGKRVISQPPREIGRDKHGSSPLTRIAPTSRDILERITPTMTQSTRDKSHTERAKYCWNYAIHESARYCSLYYTSFDEGSILELDGMHQGFQDLEQAWYFMIHGHKRDMRPNVCIWCIEEEYYGNARILLDWQTKRMTKLWKSGTGSVEFEEESSPGNVEPGEGFGLYYAVAKSRKTGVFNSREEAKKQVDGFSNSE